MTTFEQIKNWLTEQKVAYQLLHHEPTRTSAEAAKIRGQNLQIGGKALVLKIGDEFKLFVLSGAKQLDSVALRKHFQVKKIRFATPDELLKLTGLVPGSVPPFGRPILNLDLFVDESIKENKKVAFNAGSLTDSMVVSVNDYFRVSQPAFFKFSKD